MNYGIILASGTGVTMKSNVPKQFLEIENVPVIVYTIQSMLHVTQFDYIYIAVKRDYEDYMQELIKKHIRNDHDKNRIKIVEGGHERIDSIINATAAIAKNNELTEDDVVVIHDAVRPFAPERVFIDSISGALQYNAVVAAIPAVDTIVCSDDGKKVSKIPSRSTIFHGQTPVSYRLKYFIKLLSNLTEEQKRKLTGTTEVSTYNNEPLYIIKGDDACFKITTMADMDRARSMIQK